MISVQYFSLFISVWISVCELLLQFLSLSHHSVSLFVLSFVLGVYFSFYPTFVLHAVFLQPVKSIRLMLFWLSQVGGN